MNTYKEITKNDKYHFSEDFNYYFNYKTGYTAVWGKTLEDDPEFAPFPLLADMEITTICNGIGNYGKLFMQHNEGIMLKCQAVHKEGIAEFIDVAS